jgi:hypothetical protein
MNVRLSIMQSLLAATVAASGSGVLKTTRFREQLSSQLPGNRRSEPCIRPDQYPHPGQAAHPAIVRASTRTTVSSTSTDSTNTPSTEENSSSFNCGRASFTAKDCRPLDRPARRFSGGLQWS